MSPASACAASWHVFPMRSHFCMPLTLQQGIIMFLQSLPTQSWSDRDAEVLLSDAFV